MIDFMERGGNVLAEYDYVHDGVWVTRYKYDQDQDQDTTPSPQDDYLKRILEGKSFVEWYNEYVKNHKNETRKQRRKRTKRQAPDPLFNLPITDYEAGMTDGESRKSVRRRTGESYEELPAPATSFAVKLPVLDQASAPRILKLFPGLKPGVSISQYENDTIKNYIMGAGQTTNKPWLKPSTQKTAESHENMQDIFSVPSVIPVMYDMQIALQSDLNHVVKSLFEIHELTTNIFHFIVDIRAKKDKLSIINQYLMVNSSQNVSLNGSSSNISNKTKFASPSGVQLAHGNTAHTSIPIGPEKTAEKEPSNHTDSDHHVNDTSVPIHHSNTPTPRAASEPNADNKSKSKLNSAPAATANGVHSNIVKRSDPDVSGDRWLAADQVEMTLKKRELEYMRILTSFKSVEEGEARQLQPRGVYSPQKFLSNVKFVDDIEDDSKSDVVESKDKPSNFRLDTFDTVPNEGMATVPNHILHGMYDRLAMTITAVGQIKKLIAFDKDILDLIQVPLLDATEALWELLQEYAHKKANKLALYGSTPKPSNGTGSVPKL